MVSNIEIMISSTIKDLLSDRDAIQKAFTNIPFCTIVGADPVKSAVVGRSPYIATIEMAERCDLYILILGGKYGFKLKDGRSATEVEFDAAYSRDPTKILVFQKEVSRIDSKQRVFIDKVANYYTGYWRTSYKFTYDLYNLVVENFGTWIKERALIGYKLNFFDHFIRFAIQRFPIPTTQVLYSVDEDIVEIKCNIYNHTNAIHFSKSQIYNDFWGCIASLEEHFNKWSHP